jgi:hypothetical protein
VPVPRPPSIKTATYRILRGKEKSACAVIDFPLKVLVSDSAVRELGIVYTSKSLMNTVHSEKERPRQDPTLFR